MTNPAISLVLFGVAALLMILSTGLMPDAPAQVRLIGSQLLAMLVPALVVGFYLTRRSDRPSPTPASKLGFGGGGLAWVILTSAVLGIGAAAATGVLSEIVPGWKEAAAAYGEMVEALMSPADPVLRAAAIVSVVVVAPLCEETLFRGVMLPLQRDAIRWVPAVVVLNGALFSLIHFNPLNFAALLAVGAFFAHVAVLSGSIWPSIIGHATLNLVNGVIGPALLALSPAAQEPTLTSYALVAAVFVPLTAVCWTIGARKFGGRNNDA